MIIKHIFNIDIFFINLQIWLTLQIPLIFNNLMTYNYDWFFGNTFVFFHQYQFWLLNLFLRGTRLTIFSFILFQGFIILDIFFIFFNKLKFKIIIDLNIFFEFENRCCNMIFVKNFHNEKINFKFDNNFQTNRTYHFFILCFL